MTPFCATNHSHLEIKPYQLVSRSPSWQERHVTWLKNKPVAWIPYLSHMALIALEVSFLTCSGVGCFFLYQCFEMSRYQEGEKKFFQAVQFITPPSIDLHIVCKTHQETFNHIYEAVIHKKFIWYRLRHSSAAWQPVFFIGWLQDKNPMEIDMDGANLIVTDCAGKVYYKKILHEYHQEELEKRPSKRAELKIKQFHATYIVVEKWTKHNWKKGWFSLPYIHYIFKWLGQRDLHLPSHTLSWAISHRSRYMRYAEDGAGRPHQTGTGITTLSTLECTGTSITKYDPWCTPFVKIQIPLPATSTQTFIGYKIRQSASNYMVVGYETRAGKKVHTIHKQLAIKTCISDIDYIGWNPFLTYSYFSNFSHANTRVIPSLEWHNHRLLDDEQQLMQITKRITISQIGEGNHSYQLQVIGKKNGLSGYYYKRINESVWHFESCDQIKIHDHHILTYELEEDEKFQPIVHTYEALCVKGLFSKDDIKGKLKDFGPLTLKATLKLCIGFQQVNLILYRKKTLLNFLGRKEDSFNLVVPEKYHQDSKIMAIFGYKKVFSCHLKLKEDKLTLATSLLKADFKKFQA